MIRKNYDILWKGVLEEVFDDFLRSLFPQADKHFALKRRFEYLDKELADLYPDPEKKSDTKFVDKLVKVFQSDGTEEWVLVHVEVQCRHDPLFAKRMFKYCRIFDRFDRPITAIAVFSGGNGKKLPDRYERSYQGSALTYQYNTISLVDYEDKHLAESNNPFAIVELDKISGKKNTMGIIEQVAEIRAGEALQKGIRKGRAEGKAKGKTEGRIEAKREVVKRLLSEKEFAIKKIADIAGVSVEFVEKLKKAKS